MRSQKWLAWAGLLAITLALGGRGVARALAAEAVPEARELTLEQAVEMALEGNPSLELAELSLKAARSRVAYTRDVARGIEKQEDAGIPVSTLDLARLKDVYPRQAELGEAVARRALEAAREGIRLQVEKAYYEALKAEDGVRIARTTVEKAEEQLRTARAGFNAGTLARHEVLGAEVQLADARARLITAGRLSKTAYMNLNKTLGLNLETPLKLTGHFEYRPAGEIDLEKSVSEALEKRLEVVKARADLEGMDLDLQVVGRYYTPSVYTYQQAEVARKQAEVTLRQAEQQVEFEVRAAFLSLKDAGERIAVLEKSVEQAREAVRLAQLRYEAGVATGLEVTNARLALAQAEGGALQAIYDYNLAVSSFNYSVRGGSLAPAGATPAAGTGQQGSGRGMGGG